jgi:hypothetical protein
MNDIILNPISGPLCTVCGKIFKTREALDFHIMYTKLPGHEILVQQRVKNNFAQEAMRVEAKLQVENVGLMDDYGPPTPIVTYDQPQTPGIPDDEVFDAKTGVFVKQEIKQESLMMPPPQSGEYPKPCFHTTTNVLFVPGYISFRVGSNHVVVSASQ